MGDTHRHTQLPAWASHESVWLLRRVINREARVWLVILGFGVVCYLGMKVVSPSLFSCFVWVGGRQQEPERKKRDIWSNWLPVQSVTVFHSRLINNYTMCEWQPLTRLQCACFYFATAAFKECDGASCWWGFRPSRAVLEQKRRRYKRGSPQ